MNTPRDNLLALLHGEKPEQTPHFLMGFWNEQAAQTLLPAECWDERSSCILSDHPPLDAYPETPRTEENRQHVINLGRYLGNACLGVGDGGHMMFGHGGPAEIMPRVIERTSEYKILQYEGGHKRHINFSPHSIDYFDFPVNKPQDLDSLSLPDMADPERYRDIRADAEAYRQAGFMPSASIQGFFSGIHNSFMDMENTLINLLADPGFIKELAQKLAAMNFQAVEMVMDRGVEMIDICDDLGNRDGLLMSPDLFRRFFFDMIRDLCDLVHSKGGWVHFHSHGNIEKMMPMLIDCGIDMINPFDLKEIADIDALFRAFGDKVIFVGAYNTDACAWPLEDMRSHLTSSVARARAACSRGYAMMEPSYFAEMGRERFQHIVSLFKETAR